MTSFNRSTSRRLKKLTQIPSIWEGDRRPLSSSPTQPLEGEDSQGECILWVDGSQGIVRGMDVVSPQLGPEAIVRTLMRAMEHPHSPAKPARPQRIVVRDREIQFYLRGVLQDLDIAIDYAPELPLIDELFRSFADIIDSQVPDLPPQYAEILEEKALTIWDAAPWSFLIEEQILSIEINQWDVGTLYVSVMGMMGMEYGILLYRSQESLKRFRADILQEQESNDSLEAAFLKQDCLFLTFEQANASEYDNEDEDLADLPLSEIEPSFGNIHPLEGLRSVLYEEEAIVVFVALETLIRFVRDYFDQIIEEDFPAINRSYHISLPYANQEVKSVNVTISTMPEFSAELEQMADFDIADEDEFEDEDEFDTSEIRSLRDDLIPDDSFLSLGVISWEVLKSIRQDVNYYARKGINQMGDGLPVILIQTSRSQAKSVIDNIEAAGGITGICFNPGTNPLNGEKFDLGVLQTENGDLFLFGEFSEEDQIHIEARKKWHNQCQQTNGYCGLIIAKGLTGATRGNPQLKDMMALFETQSLSSQDLGIGTLQLVTEPEWED